MENVIERICAHLNDKALDPEVIASEITVFILSANENIVEIQSTLAEIVRIIVSEAAFTSDKEVKDIANAAFKQQAQSLELSVLNSILSHGEENIFDVIKKRAERLKNDNQG